MKERGRWLDALSGLPLRLLPTYHFEGVPSGAGIVLGCSVPYLLARLFSRAR